MPECLKKSIPAGIGLFITYIGFQNVGIIQTNQYTLTQFVDIHGAINGDGIMTVLPGAPGSGGIFDHSNITETQY